MLSRLTTLVVLSGLACGAGCRVDSVTPPDPPAAGDPTPADDPAVVTAAVRHFANQKVVEAFHGREAKSIILVDQETAGTSTIYLSDGQIQGETRTDGWVVPTDLCEGLRRRNDKPVPLSDWRFGEGIVTANLRLESGLLFSDRLKEHPDAKAWVLLWLPAYSSDGKTAVVRFMFGPTSHGASATYLLTWGEGGWTVQKWAFAYYA